MQLPRHPRTVLFLIADTGAGHRSAANAIQRAMCQLCSSAEGKSHRLDWRAHIVDAIAECGRFPLRQGISLYGPIVTRRPQLYGRLFRITNTSVRFDRAWRACQLFVREGICNLVEWTRPDVIVSLHPLLNHITLRALQDLHVRVPFITVVTDLVGMHCSWFAPQVDACIVPTEQARQGALAAGVPALRVHRMGMPIDPAFAQPEPRPLEERRHALGLDPARPTVLVVGGGEGAGGLAERVSAICEHVPAAQVLVVTGRNRQLYAELRNLRRAGQLPMRIFGFVDNMPELMRAADAIVTKAGPGTICEAAAAGLPILLTGAIPGQEEGNVEYVLAHGLGELATTPDALVGALQRLLGPGTARPAQLREDAHQHSHAHASLEIARFVFSMLPKVDAPSVWDSAPRQLLPPRRAHASSTGPSVSQGETVRARGA